MRTHVIYLPGLGVGYDPFRGACLKAWRLYGVTAELVPLRWTDGRSFDEKYQSVRRAIQRAPGKRIVVIGESAGATMALYVAEHEKGIDTVITLCGVTNEMMIIAPSLRRRAPALVTGLKHLSRRHNHVPVVSLRAWYDPVVSRRFCVPAYAEERVVWSIGHLVTIGLCLTFYAPWLLRFVRKT